jgi:hypothetical protein
MAHTAKIFLRRVRPSVFETARRLLAHRGKMPYTERLIESFRRDCLDHVVVVGARHLRHVLLSYMSYYNSMRTHLSLNCINPAPAKPVA